MDGFCSGFQSSLDYVVDLQVALAGGRRADVDCFVSIFGEKGVFICFGVDGYGGYAQLPGCAHHPDGDLSSVGDQDLVEHPQVRCTAKVKPFWREKRSMQKEAIGINSGQEPESRPETDREQNENRL